MKNRINKIIKSLSITKIEFATNLNVSSGNVTEWVKGRSKPTSKAILKMIEVYNVNLNWLFTGEGEMYIDDKDRQLADQKAQITSLKNEIYKIESITQSAIADFKPHYDPSSKNKNDI